MYKYIILFTAVILVIIKIQLHAQQPNQTIRGIVTDAMSGAPIPFATVMVMNSDPVIGTTTSNDGKFQLNRVPVGRYDIQISFIGYEPTLIKEVVITSAKEVYLEVVLRESTFFLDEVVVRPSVSKNQPLNIMATVSTRMLSVEEASRYAGGFDDPARLASAFAGVASNVRSNGIVIRGNAPRMLQWKMEGVEIPNPNHFADLNSFGGGGLTALSSNLLANSDFFTGAFPAEYSNALSGVFDIFMRKGTSNDFEHSVQLGLIGIDAASEGPLRRKGNSSYLFNYRYSTLSLVQPLLPDDAEKISYQDLSFKLHFPTEQLGTFSVWGIGLIDQSGQTAKRDSTLWEYMQDREEGSPNQYMGAGGINHVYFLNNNTHVKTTLATTISGLDWNMKRLNRQYELLPQSDIQSVHEHIVLTSAINKKISISHTNKTGFTITGMWYDLLLNEVINPGEAPTTIVDDSGNSALISGFTSSKIRVSNQVTMNLGLTGHLFTLNKNFTIEPRAGIKWSLSDNKSISMAYGLHSRLEKMPFYLTRSSQTGERINKDIDFSKAHHIVLGYDYRVSDNMVLKIEPYYQWLFDIPITYNGTFSFINLQDEWFFNEPLVNAGNGRNYGLDVTLERYVSRGYYYMVTASVFQSEYRGADNVWRNTAFNRRYLFNILGGKEWNVGKNNQNIISLNVRSSIQGGDTFTPVDESASIASEDIILNENNAYSMRNDPLLVFHFTASYTINKQRSTREISFKILNTTVQNDFFGFRYNFQSKSVEKHMEAIVIPNLSYKISF